MLMFLHVLARWLNNKWNFNWFLKHLIDIDKMIKAGGLYILQSDADFIAFKST